MWLMFSIITIAMWSLSEMFYKKGNSKEEKYSHLKTTIFVGIFMFIHAIIVLITSGISFDFKNILIYLPVSLCYIVSMAFSYFGIRFIEESIADPIENTSGAIVPILCAVILHQEISIYSFIAIFIIIVGILGVGFIEHKEKNRKINITKKIAVWAIAIPLVYALLDALGTFLDIYYLDIESNLLFNVNEDTIENVANTCYEFTFFIVAVILYIFIRFKGEKLFQINENKSIQKDKMIAAFFETLGQFSYVFALSDNGAIASPLIAAGVVVISLLLSRLWLKEKLSKWQYAFIFIVIIGIIILSIIEG